jgi:hypothetical protein
MYIREECAQNQAEQPSIIILLAAAWRGRTMERPDMLSDCNRLESLRLQWEMR